MKIDVLTLFPEMFSPLKCSLTGKALDKGLYELNCHNIRDYSTDKHKRCDDAPFGGGAGMVMTPQPIHDCINVVDPDRTHLHVATRKDAYADQGQAAVRAIAPCGTLRTLRGR